MKNPWFKFYAADYLLDKKVDDLPLEAQGLLVRMWCAMHIHGGLPNNPSEIARKCMVSETVVQTHMQTVCKLFAVDENGMLFSRRMDAEMEKSEKISFVRSIAAKRRHDLLGWKNPSGNQDENATVRQERVRRARALGRHTDQEWMDLVQSTGNICVRCKKSGDYSTLTRDHIIPLSQNGSDAIGNIQPLCQSCNSAKGIDRTDYRSPANNHANVMHSESESESDITTPLPPKRGKRRKREEIISSFSQGTREVVNMVLNTWPSQRPGNHSAIKPDIALLSSRVDEILKNPAVTSAILIKAANLYLAEKKEFPHAPEFFYGPGKNGDGPPWRHYARMAYHMQQQAVTQ